MRVQEFKKGSMQIPASQLNQLVAILNMLTGGEYVNIKSMPGGKKTIDLNLNRLLPKIPTIKNPFPAIITNETTEGYAFTEAQINSSGELETMPGASARSGVAKEINGITGLCAAGQDFFVDNMREIKDASGKIYYRFMMMYPPYGAAYLQSGYDENGVAIVDHARFP